MFDTDEIQLREALATVENVDEETGTVDAKLAAYEETVQLEPGLWEVFGRGAFAGAVGNPSRVKVSDQGHGNRIVGRVLNLRDEKDGLYGQLRIPDTSYGRDLLTLLRSETLTDLSVEFRVIKRGYDVTPRPSGGVLVRHNKATLVGVSPVGQGAYGDKARVLSVREAARDLERERALARLGSLTAGPKA